MVCINRQNAGLISDSQLLSKIIQTSAVIAFKFQHTARALWVRTLQKHELLLWSIYVCILGSSTSRALHFYVWSLVCFLEEDIRSFVLGMRIEFKGLLLGMNKLFLEVASTLMPPKMLIWHAGRSLLERCCHTCTGQGSWQCQQITPKSYASKRGSL